MSLHKRPGSPHWQYYFRVGGVRFRGSTGTEDRRAAELRLEAAKAKARDQVAADQERAPDGRKHITLNQATGRYWTEHAEALPSSKVTWGKLCYFNDLIGEQTRLADIDDEIIAEYVARRRAKTSGATVNRDLTMLRALMNRADRRWRFAVGRVDWAAHRSSESAGRVRWLGEEEEKRLFEALRADFHPMVRFALATGLRLANVVTLTWEQVDFRERIVTVRQKSKRPGGDVHTVPLTDALVALLANEKGKHKARVFSYQSKIKRTISRDDVIQKGEWRPFKASGGWAKAWRAALASAGVSDFRFHDLRHTAGTRVQRRTGNLAITGKLLGHRSAQSTLRYAHASTDDVRAAIEAVENAGGEVRTEDRPQERPKIA